MFVFQNRMGLQIGKNFCEQFFQYANDNSQELATVQTVGDAPIHALLDVCLDFHSVRSSRTSPSGGHFDRAVQLEVDYLVYLGGGGQLTLTPPL